MQERLFKQIMVFIFTTIFLCVIVFGFYNFALKPRPSCFDKKQNGSEIGVDCGGNCKSCEIDKLQPLDFSPSAFSVVQDNKMFIYNRIVNPNEK